MLGLDLIAAHMVGDYILQTDYMARNKLTNWRVRCLHVTVYCLPFVLVAWLHTTRLDTVAAFIWGVWLTHFLTDSRRWASGDKWPPKPILVDQAIHLATLAVLTRILTWG